jgi:hypothetical protein
MFNSAILDVAIGMIFVYLLLSLICSAANEVIEAWLRNRATDLERGLRELLSDPSGNGLVAKIYNHPLVSGLFEGVHAPAALGMKDRLMGRIKLPSYIPSRTFALALMDTILPAKASTAGGTAGATPAANAPSEVAVKLAGTASPPAAGAAPVNPLQNLRNSVATLGNSEVQQALTALIDAAGSDVAQARENIEAWFDSSMDRVSGWYKRRSQMIVLVIGFLVAILVNADSVTIAKRLSADRALRESIVAAADAYAKASASPSNAASPTAPAKPAPVANECFKKECEANADAPQCKLKKSQCELEGLGLPIGWHQPDDQYKWTGWSWSGDAGGWRSQLYWHFLGWLITALAISLGAPFWFDMLNKLIVVRSTVKPKEKSPNEASKS